MAVPLGCLYTPNKKIPGLLTLPYEPIYCKSCRAILNPFCRIDFVSKTWTCPFCFTRNHLPQQYAQHMSETSLPGELMPGMTTIEYKMPQRGLSPPVFFLVVDTAMIEDELEAIKQSLIVTLDMIPETAYVGLITFGTVVQLYDLAYTSCVKSYVFKGDKEINAGKVQQLLAAFRGRNQSGGHADISEPIRRFLMPRSECEYQLSAILEDLQQDPWPVQAGYRPLRCTGAALSVAVGALRLMCVIAHN
jgi:protein transport protein SEC23